MTYKEMLSELWKELQETDYDPPYEFAKRVYEDHSYETSFAILWAIASLAKDFEDFQRMWEGPTPKEEEEILRLAVELNKKASSHLQEEDEFFWGIESVDLSKYGLKLEV